MLYDGFLFFIKIKTGDYYQNLLDEEKEKYEKKVAGLKQENKLPFIKVH